MALTDHRGNPVSTRNQAALDTFEKALVQFHSYFDDPVATIEEAIGQDPDFVLGHVFRATALATMAERQFEPMMRESVTAAEALHDNANERERMLTTAARKWLDGDWHGATFLWEDVLAQYPRDAFALQAAHLSDFYRGDAVNLRDRVARVLPHYDADATSYPYVLGMQAFGFEECNQFQRAEETARQGLELQPRDAWGIHALAHVLEMQGRYDEGIDLYRSREKDWAPDNGFAFHNWWHLSLYHIERAEYAQVLEIFDRHISPEPSDLALTLLDATALLWRLHLIGVDTGGRWQPVAAKWAEKMESETGYYAFNDMHAIMSLVATENMSAAERIVARMREAAADDHTSNGAMSREVGVPVGEAIVAFGRGDFATAVRNLIRVRHIANRFGGSNAQRDVLSQTLLEAAIRGGERGRAINLLNERTAHKPQSPLAWRYRARLHRQAGESAEAVAQERKADSLIYPRDVA